MKNILFIFSDQQRQDTMGVYGQKLNVTPNLDKLAEKGTVFENSFTVQPVCGPARSCLQTGIYPSQLGTFVNGVALPKNVKTMADYLNEKGYETAYVGKWHLASDDGIEEYHYKPVPEDKRGGYKDYWMASDILEFTSHGYDGYVFNKDMEKVEFKGYRADKITDFALDYLDNKVSNSPFFLFISYIEPHHQNDRKTYEGPLGSKEKFQNFDIPEDIKSLGYGDSRENYGDYLGCCNSIDKNVGRLVKRLEEKGILEDTLIIYTSDHGCHFKTRNRNLKKPGGDDYKRGPEDGVIKTPLIISGLEYLENKREKTFVSLLDLPPTILEWVGCHSYEQMQGKSIKERINEKNEEVFIQISESFVGRAIRTKEFLYCVYAPEKNPWKDGWSEKYEGLYFYDLKKDLHELNNLIEDINYKSQIETMKKKLIESIKKYENLDCEIK
ncbi:MAG: sulfatase-like hydrolase/transferase [Cetobacterium sp.]|uniref:sulfatase-like hydrolase/transferase n=1 Tax=Cetobacterium sp. TaxID=2071632 RepID=UPI003F3146E6